MLPRRPEPGDSPIVTISRLAAGDYPASLFSLDGRRIDLPAATWDGRAWRIAPPGPGLWLLRVRTRGAAFSARILRPD